MPHKIFLSHNHNDKPLVEAVAIKLASIFGLDQVFYDSWSIQPGDGIIDLMNKGLEAPEFVFFFVSKNSLASGMVKLEWQNALYLASKGKTRIIPVRIDGSDMPAILKQTLFIDMHNVGLEAAIAQIVSVAQRNASFTPQHQGFSNLTYSASKVANGAIEIVVRASHLMEPNPRFLALISNFENEVTFGIRGETTFVAGYSENAGRQANGRPAHGILLHCTSRALTPAHPVRIDLGRQGTTEVGFLDLFHQRGENEWVPVPREWPGLITANRAL